MGGHRQAEACCAESADHGVVVSQVRWTGTSPRLHQADRPAVARQGFADGDRPPAHGGLPVATARGHADLREDGVDHGVDEVVLVGHVAVQRHGRDLEHLGERAHGEGLEPARVRMRRSPRAPLAPCSGGVAVELPMPRL